MMAIGVGILDEGRIKCNTNEAKNQEIIYMYFNVTEN